LIETHLGRAPKRIWRDTRGCDLQETIVEASERGVVPGALASECQIRQGRAHQPNAATHVPEPNSDEQPIMRNRSVCWFQCAAHYY